MKIDIKFNLWFVIVILILAIFAYVFTVIIYKLAIINNDFTIKMQELTDDNVIWTYKCNPYDSGFYNCYGKFMNLTGQYCNGTLVCQNIYEVKK